MGRTQRQDKPLDTIWEIDDELWQRIEPILWEDAPATPKAHGGRPRIDWRSAINGTIFRLRSGCQWNKLPKHFGDDSSVHRWFQRWCRNGIFEQVWAVLLEECSEFGAVDWRWQAADGRLGKARFGGQNVGKNPTDRGQERHQAVCLGRARRGTTRGGDRRSQRSGSETARGNNRGNRGRTSRPQEA